jgi:hypothetical protein
VVVAAIILVVLAACAPRPEVEVVPRVEPMWIAIPESPGAPPFGVLVVDHAGLIRHGAPGQVTDTVSTGTTVAAIPGGVTVTFMAGECDDQASVTIDPVGDGYRLGVELHSSGTRCASSVTFRSIDLFLSQPVPAEAFELP